MITGLEVLNEVCDRIGWSQIDTLEGSDDLVAEERKLLKLLNRVLRSLDAGDDWPLLRTEGDILTLASEEDSAKFLLSNGEDTIINMDSTIGFDQSYVDRAISIDGHNTVYRIKKVVTDRSVDLNRIWLGDTNSGLSDELVYTIAQDRYALPEDFDRPIGKWSNFFAPNNIQYISPEEMAQRRRSRGGTILTGDPQFFTVYGMAADGLHRLVHLDPYPEDQRVLTFPYQKVHPEILNDNDRLLYPHRYISVIIEGVIYLAKRDYESDERMGDSLQDFLREFNRQQGNPEITSQRMQITPSGLHRQRQRQKWARGSSNIDWGDFFDRIDKVGF